MRTRDEILWETARRRACFKKSLFAYMVVNAFLWAIWFMSGNHIWHFHADHFWHLPWPAWVMFWWGVGLAFSFVKAYVADLPGSTEAEYEKLKRRADHHY